MNKITPDEINFFEITDLESSMFPTQSNEIAIYWFEKWIFQKNLVKSLQLEIEKLKQNKVDKDVAPNQPNTA